MDVRIKSFTVDMDVKNNGIEFEVKEGDDHPGDCYVTRAGVTWCRGRTTRSNGVRLSWKELAAILASTEAKAAALRAARSV